MLISPFWAKNIEHCNIGMLLSISHLTCHVHVPIFQWIEGKIQINGLVSPGKS